MQLTRMFATACAAGWLSWSGCADAGSTGGLPVTSPTPLSRAPSGGTGAVRDLEVGVRGFRDDAARAIATVVLTALHRGATGSGTVRSSPRWSASCPEGGDARIELPDTLPFIGEVSLVNTTTVWTACAYRETESPDTVRLTGRTVLNGTWSSSAPSSPVQIQGTLDTNVFRPWTIDLLVDGATGVVNGQILNLPVNGVVDGPFIPISIRGSSRRRSLPVVPPPARPFSTASCMSSAGRAAPPVILPLPPLLPSRQSSTPMATASLTGLTTVPMSSMPTRSIRTATASAMRATPTTTTTA